MNELETTLRKSERLLRNRQVATFWKIPNDLRLTEDTVVFGERGPCDFIGHTEQGIALLIEAKMCQSSRLAVPHKRGIQGHQWMALRDADAAGAIALIVWQRGHEVSVLPFKEAQRLLGTRRSIPWPGGLSLGLKADDASLIIADALVEVIDLDRKRSNASRQMIQGSA